MAPEAVAGRIAVSKAGRDAGRSMVILAQVDENHVLVADGSLRKVENPKKKKLRHLRVTPRVAQTIQADLLAGLPVKNADLVKVLQENTGVV